jgi:ATP-dependent helicase/nuclease subunit A
MTDGDGRFDPQQSAALAVRDASVGLSAGAGCGKTHVLTERFLRHLDPPDRFSLRQIVALTFTEKAARELRDRVRRECRNRLARLDDPADVEHWRDVLRSLEIARIGTFHAFCGQLLKRFSSEAEIDPAFAVLEEAVAPSIRQNALDSCCRRWLANRDPDLIDLAAEIGLTPLRQTLAQLLATVDPIDLGPWLAKDVDTILSEWLALRDSVVIPRLTRELVDQGTPVIDLLIANPPSNAATKARRLVLMDVFPRLGASTSIESDLVQIAENAKIQGTQAKHLSDPSVYVPLKDGLTLVREKARSILDVLTFDQTRTIEVINRGRQLGRLLMEAIETYSERKQRDGRLDFADLQRKTRGLLREHPEVVEHLIGEIQTLLIDEFQDTDPIQAEIIRALGGPSRGDGRLFLVGDRKQSIYRFRGAKPSLFEEMRDEFPDAGRRVLGRNYRSVPDVIHFVNALFAGTFPGGDHALEPHREPASEAAAVQFVWSSDPDEPKPSAADRRRIEAQWLARLLARRLREGWVIWDARLGASRNATAADVVFLFRTLNDSAEYELALESVGLDFYVSGGAAFYARQEVLDVVNLLSVIEDSCDPLALAATLRGPFGCVSDDGLYWLSTSLEGGLLAGFEARERLSTLSRQDRQRLTRFGEFLDRLRAIKDRVPIAALLDRALDESGFEAAVLAEPMGRRKRANVRKLVERARQFDVESGLTLADFVSRLQNDLRNPPREAEAATNDEDSDAIQFMTIHASKGKEFPIVVLPDLGKDRGNRTSVAVFRPELGLLVRAKDDSEEPAGQDLGRLLDRHFETAEEEEEALRLFYVATTRAKDVLILSAGGTPNDSPKSPAMALLARRFDRSTGACLDPNVSTVPPVLVIPDPPEFEATDSRIPRRRRPRYLAVARAIEGASAFEAATEPVPPVRSSLINLDALAETSPSVNARLQLFRDVLRRWDVANKLSVERQVERAARGSGMFISPAAVDEVAQWIDGFLKTEAGNLFARSPSLDAVVSWSIAWPPDGERPTVFRGTVDLVVGDGDGGSGILVLEPPDMREASVLSALRIGLGARAVARSSATTRGWVARLGHPVEARSVPPISDAALGRLIDLLNSAGNLPQVEPPA